MSTVIDNFTVTETNYEILEGNGIPVTVLTLSPLSGFAITASDFSATITSPVESISFAQDGDDVLMTITFEAAYQVTSSLSIPICMSGLSTTVTVNLAVNYAANLTNASSSTTPSLINISGSYGTTSNVFTSTIQATSGYYFLNEPTCVVSAGASNDYSISNVKTLNSNNQLTSIIFTTEYTFPVSSVTGDIVTVNASAIELPSVAAEEVRSYSIANGAINPNGETRRFTALGILNADWNLTVNNGISDIYDYSSAIPSSGEDFFDIVFPAGSGVTYTFTLTGDLLSPFPLPTTWTIIQTDTNTAPIAEAQTVSALHNNNALIELFGSDAEGDALTYIITSLPTENLESPPGTVITTVPFTLPSNEVTYDASSIGSDNFQFKVNDGALDSIPQIVTINTVAAVTTIPIGVTYNGSTLVTGPSPATVDVGASGPFGRSTTINVTKNVNGPGGGTATSDYDIIITEDADNVGLNLKAYNIPPTTAVDQGDGTVDITYLFTLEVADGGLVESTDAINITVGVFYYI